MSFSSSSCSGGKCSQISLDEIKEATGGFNESNVLGKGGEGKVYLAKIKLNPDSERITHVAVKHLKTDSEQFGIEIKTISKIHHPNLVSLLGYCDEAGQKMILYEYMKNGSLSNYVKKKSKITLSWQQRVRICLDAARGLRHLHAKTDEFSKGIIHRDVKPDNILLDENWVAKVSDFGLFKLSDPVQIESEMQTHLKGTGGYFAPEYLRFRTVTRKIDVYAFGIVLFQVLCLKNPWDRGDDESYYGSDDEDFALWALQNVDPKIKDEIPDDSLEMFTKIIGESLKKDPRERPTMDRVVSSLEIVLSQKSKEVHYDDAKQGRAATEPDSVHSTGGPYHREVSEKGDKAILLDVAGGITKAAFAKDKYPKAVSKFGLYELLHATDYFNDAKVIVRGDLAITYEGLLEDGRTVGVKRYKMDDSIDDENVFRNEIDVLSKYRNERIVSIIGKCEESKQMIVVHEFMKNGTLEDHLLKKESSLSWDQRLKICIDAAKGLEYVHDHGNKRMIHTNIKSAIILLDENWEAKISDIGFQSMRPANTKNSAVSTRQLSTYKYVDPYYNLTGQLSRRSDVYSFGIVLFDVLFGMEYLFGQSEYRGNKIKQLIRNSLNNDHSLLDEIDQRLKGQISVECFNEFVELASSCTSDNPTHRPTMKIVVEKLKSVLTTSQHSQPS